MELTLIAAVAKNRCIGRNGGLTWSHPDDLAHFRALTWGHPVLMGHRTWQSLPTRFRPLPGRRNVVLARSVTAIEGADVFGALETALERLAHDRAPRVFIIGGAEIYRQAIPLATRLELTEIDATIEGDAFFPAYDDWHLTASEPHSGGFRFVTYARPKEVESCP